jgi:hypothetical protein
MKNDETKQAMIGGLQAHQVNLKQTQVIQSGELLHWRTHVNFFVGGVNRSGGLAFVLSYPEVGGPVFYVLRDLLDDSRRAGRVACALLYLFAFAFGFMALGMQLGWAVRGMLL